VDIVLTDLMLQQGSGLELLKRCTTPTRFLFVLTQYGTADSPPVCAMLAAEAIFRLRRAARARASRATNCSRKRFR